MRNTLAIAVVLAMAAGSAVAQTQIPAAKDGPQNSAINSSDSSNRQTTMPVAGANSFTEGEAKSRIEGKGFTSSTDLKKDNDGIWRGWAMREGRRVEVALDYQGNVFFGPAAVRSTTGQGSAVPVSPAPPAGTTSGQPGAGR